MDHEHRSANENIKEGGANTITAAQFAAIEAAAARAKPAVVFETEPERTEGAPTFIWQKDHILVDRGVDEKSISELRHLRAKPARNADGSPQKESRYLPKLLQLDTKDDPRTTRQIVEELNTKTGLKGRVFVNNLLYVTHGDGANLCPANEPTPVRRYPETTPYPPPAGGNAGEGVRITVIDTGLSPDWKIDHPWLYDKDQSPPTEVDGDREPNTFGPYQQISQHAGHGVFIAGLIRCVAPKASVYVTNTMRWAGAMHEFEVARTIIDALDATPPPDIISLSAGCLINTTKNPEPPQAMLGVLRRMSEHGCNTLLVVAAGNDGHGPESPEVFYPAAFAGWHDFDEFLVTVGALREERDGRACFSNFGKWVTVYEDGENLINAFPNGTYTYREPLSATVPPKCVYHDPPLEEGCTCVTAPALGTVARFRGMASWSGTSFSTPIIVGRVARHMTENLTAFAGNPRAAMKDLFRYRETIKDVGDDISLSVFPPVSS